MVCHKCGNNVTGDKCPICGTPIPNGIQYIDPIPPKKHMPTALIVVLAVVGAIVGLSIFSAFINTVLKTTLHVPINTSSIQEQQIREGPTESNETSSFPTETMGQKNALRSAREYLNYTAFSYQGLIEQLEYEKFSHEEAVYAADNCGADWYEQATKSAKEYLNFTSFSRDGLIEQLEYEGFTHEQAVYGVEANGY